jgi:hypothetical protein
LIKRVSNATYTSAYVLKNVDLKTKTINNLYSFLTSFEPDFKLITTKIRLKLHFRLLVLLFLFTSLVGFSQEKTKDSTINVLQKAQTDSIPAKDTTSKAAKNSFEDPIFSNAKDSTIYSLDGKKVFLYGEATVNYQKIELKAQYIEFDMEKKEVFAKGLPDSTGKIIGSPVFKDGGQTYNMDDIYYNFNSKKAKITGVVTEQDGGFIHSKVTKKMKDNTVNLFSGKFTTCDQKHPHYYIAITKGKIIPNDKIIAGPAYIVIEDVPLPIGIPFGFFPNSRKRASGVILPTYGEEVRRGVSLTGGGFYFGISDYIDLKLTGDIYSFGSWAVQTKTTYKKRYRYYGGIGIDYSVNKMNDTTKSNSYNITWTHSQDQKASLNSTFSANVKLSSTNYNSFNARDINSFLENTTSSSISYAKTFVGTPFKMTLGFSHTQNNLTKRISVNFPRLSLSMDKVYPFKRKSNIGSPAWYEKIGFNVNTSVDNKVSVLEKNLFKKSVIDSMSNGIKHDIPLATSFSILKFITVSPGIGYSESWHLKTIRKHWNNADSTVVIDTVNGFRRAWQYSTSVSMSTRIYGMFNFGKDKAIQAIRHVITPSISISYSPDFSDPRYGFYKLTQINAKGDSAKYSIFERGINTGPGQGKSGTISFSIGNNLEMKVRSKKDTVNNFKKIKIFENLSFGSSYNLLADSLNLAPISVSGSTRLFDKVNINFSGSLDPYDFNKNNQRINKFVINQSGKLARLTSASFNFDFSLNSTKKENSTKNKTASGEFPAGTNPNNPEFGQALNSSFMNNQTVDFDVPWNLNIRYSFSYSKPFGEKNTFQTLGFSGDLSLTPKWKIGFNSGYDFKNQKLVTTTMNIFRDLHCWEMSISIVPLGVYKSYSFLIKVKSGMLQELKWSKRDSYLDNL